MKLPPPEISSPNLPTVAQFKRSIYTIIDSATKVYSLSADKEQFFVYAYINPTRRVQEKTPPWYAVIPYGSYKKETTENDRKLDRKNDGGVVYAEKENNFEIVRVDSFSKPTEESLEQNTNEKNGVILPLKANFVSGVFPGFYIEGDTALGPTGVKIPKSGVELNAVRLKFQCMLDGKEAKTIEESHLAFRNNMSALYNGLDDGNIKNVSRSDQLSRIKYYDQKAGSLIPMRFVRN